MPHRPGAPCGARLACVVTLAGVLLAGCTAHHRAVPAVGPPRRGGTLRVAVDPLDSLDPAMATTPSELEAASALSTPLTRWDPATLTPRPGVASSWSVSADQKVWTFMLARGVKFSDGRLVTAGDVAYTYDRVAKRGSGSPSAYLLEDLAGYGALHSSGQGSGLAVADAGGGAVRITLISPLAVLPSVLANPALGIVAASSAGAVGSGPFVVARSRPGDVDLVRAPGSSAWLDGIELVSFPDDSAGYAAFRRGRVDVAAVPPAQAKGAASAYHQKVSRPLDAELFYGFNLRNPAVSDVRLREAVVHAVDPSTIASGPYRHSAIPLAGVVIGGSPCGPACAFDPARSRTLVRQVSGSSPAPVLTIDYDEDPTQDVVARVIKSDLDKVGIRVSLHPHPLADYQSLAAGGGGELLRLGWVAGYPGPDGVLGPLFMSGSSENLTGLTSPAVDAAIAKARSEPDVRRRALDYEIAERAVEAQVPVVPLVQFESHVVRGAAVGGLVIDGMGMWDPANVWMGGRIGAGGPR